VTALTLAYSPCPNDTYVFAALTNGLLADAPRVSVHLADIEELNDAASHGRFELVKVSYGAIPYLGDRYRILRSGGAIGRGCGPLLVARPDASPALFAEFVLLRLALARKLKTVQLRFDRIISAVAEGTVDAGLIIHESRFTYREAGLIAIADLGEWWENMTLLPIPLGAILVRNDVEDDVARAVQGAIRTSLAFARVNESAVMPYVREHAFEMSEDVMRRHIALYVNEFSDDIGEIGIEAVHALYARAHDAGILGRTAEPRFV
jgi:1,4-dihydroxy-6-naphthoate synthase